MPDEQLDDKTLDSSPSDPQPSAVEADTGSAASGAPPDNQPPDTAVDGAKESSSAERPESLEDVKSFFTGDKKTVEKPKSVDTKPEKAKTVTEKPAEKKPEEKADVDTNPLADYTDEEKRRISKKTQDRIHHFHNKWREADGKRAELEPLANEGKIWKEVIDGHGVRNDLRDITDDASIADAIRFQAALNRVTSGRGSQADAQMIQAVYSSLDETRAALGLASPQATPDLSEIEKAIAKARDDFDFSALDEAVKKLKGGQKATPPQVAPVPQIPHQQIQQAQPQQQQGPSPDDRLYSRMVEQEISSMGIAPDKVWDHVQKTLFPMVVDKLSKVFPGQNPVEAYSRLTPQAQFDSVVRAQREFQKSQEALKPAKPVATQSTPRPVRTSGTQQVGSNANASPLSAAKSFLTQGS